jgi:hypothetical protein
MAYVSAQLNLAVPSFGLAPAIWTLYGTDVHTDVDADDFISDGLAKGMKVNDIVIYQKTTATIGATLHSVRAVVTAGAMSLSPAILA